MNIDRNMAGMAFERAGLKKPDFIRFFPKARHIGIFSVNGGVTVIPRLIGQKGEGIELYAFGKIPEIKEYCDDSQVLIYGLIYDAENNEDFSNILLGSQPIHIVAIVPPGTTMQIREVAGVVSVGDVNGSLLYANAMGNVVTIGEMDILDVNTSASLVTAKAPYSSLSAFLKQGSRLIVAGYKTYALEATLHKKCQIDLRCKIQRASCFLGEKARARIWPSEHSRDCQTYYGIRNIEF